MDLGLVSASIIATLNLDLGEPNKNAYNALKRVLRQKDGNDSAIDEVAKLLEKNPASKPHRTMLRLMVATLLLPQLGQISLTHDSRFKLLVRLAYVTASIWQNNRSTAHSHRR